ncbi:hypothetical protein GRAN_0275 [Granulicella sibirica]|uniref:Uncharacterized protein n=1 Tax=Granulicella sibirica TaxID=2479048 RepID=A0A4Q0T084_9BACT|nr:hypothetical protein GRAN_0275 [Granulicella sibirica]
MVIAFLVVIPEGNLRFAIFSSPASRPKETCLNPDSQLK